MIKFYPRAMACIWICIPPTRNPQFQASYTKLLRPPPGNTIWKKMGDLRPGCNAKTSWVPRARARARGNFCFDFGLRGRSFCFYCSAGLVVVDGWPRTQNKMETAMWIMEVFPVDCSEFWDFFEAILFKLLVKFDLCFFKSSFLCLFISFDRSLVRSVFFVSFFA